jgi:hypothetical protein
VLPVGPLDGVPEPVFPVGPLDAGVPPAGALVALPPALFWALPLPPPEPEPDPPPPELEDDELEDEDDEDEPMDELLEPLRLDELLLWLGCCSSARIWRA